MWRPEFIKLSYFISLSFQTKKSWFLREHPHAAPSSTLEAGAFDSTSFSIHTKQTAATLLKSKYGKYLRLKYLLSLVHTYLAGATEFLS